MHNSLFARFLVRLRKVVWLLPLAIAAVVVALTQEDVSKAIMRRLPLATVLPVRPYNHIYFIGIACLTVVGSVQVAVRLTRARKAGRLSGVMALLVLVVVVFFIVRIIRKP